MDERMRFVTQGRGYKNVQSCFKAWRVRCILAKRGSQGKSGTNMNRNLKITSILSALLAIGAAFTAYRLSGQQPARATPAVKAGNAPGLKVTDLGHSPRTYRVNMAKGDEIVSGLTEFAE